MDILDAADVDAPLVQDMLQFCLCFGLSLHSSAWLVTWKSRCVLVEVGVLPVAVLPRPLAWQGRRVGLPVAEGGLLWGTEADAAPPWTVLSGRASFMSQVSISVLMEFKVRNTMMFWTAAVASEPPSSEGGCFPGIPPCSWGLYVH